MKKLLTTLCVLASVFVCILILPTRAEAAVEGFYTYKVSSYRVATIMDCSTSISGDITIPSKLGGYNVTAIAAGAFSDCKQITSVTIPEGVRDIGSYAFSNCSGMISATIPDSVNTIENSVFSGCSSLKTITIPFVGDSPKASNYFPQYPLGYLFGTSEYDGSTATTQCSRDFSTDTVNRTYYIPDSLESVTVTGGEIFYGSFYNCSNLTSVNILDDTTSIRDFAFYNCTSLNSVTIPNSVTTIGKSAFYNCSDLPSVTISHNVTSIGDSAFYNCSALKSVTIGNSVISIGDSAFYNCSSLKSVTIPDSVTTIDKSAFYNCSGLVSVTVGKAVTGIGDAAFYNCGNLTYNTYHNAKYLGNDDNPYLVLMQAVSTDITDCAIYADTRIVYDSAFLNCSNLTSVTIPDSVTTIGGAVFSGCSSLEEITVPFVGGSLNATVGKYKQPFGYYFGKTRYNGSYLVSQPFATATTEYISFYFPTSLKCVTITGGTIPKGAFEKCRYLTSVTMGDGVTNIGYYAFRGCSSITSVVVPDSVAGIGLGAFAGCNSLAEITIPFVGDSRKTAEDTYQYPFGYLFGTDSYSAGVPTKQYFYGPSTSVLSAYQFYIPASVKTVTVTGGSILHGAFYGCNNLTNVVLMDGVTEIGDEAFYQCCNLTSVTVPNSVASIGNSAFSKCNKLEEITLPFVGDCRKTATATNQYPFGYIFGTVSYTDSVPVEQYYYGTDISETTSTVYYIPASLKSVTITGGSILRGAFYNCETLTNIVLLEGITAIGEEAFYNCTGITGIVIPDSVCRIGEGAFFGCSSLESMTIPFVGERRRTEKDTNQYPFGYIFGTVSYTGSEKTVQAYYLNTNTVVSSVYYLPGSLKTVEITGGNILYGAFSNCKRLTSITLPDSAAEIGANAFYNCVNLTAVTIPDSVTKIESSAFDGCSGLMGIWVGNGNQMFCSDENGVLYNKDKTQLIRAPGGIAGSYTIPDGVTTIGASAFYGCVFLKTVTVGNNVTSIGNSAFYNCQRLNAVNFNAEKCPEMGSSDYPAFGGCTELVTFNIGENVTQLPAFALSGCTGITSIILPESVVYVGNDAFCDSTKLGSVWYRGSVSDKENMQICAGNDYFIGADWHYNVCKEHTYDYVCDSTCNVCDVTRVTTHDYAAATCIAPKTCKTCGETVGDVLGHSFTNYNSNNDATCTNDGTETAKCDRCGEMDIRIKEGTAKGHNYKSVVTPADCLNQGYTTHTCHCGATYVDAYVDALGHNLGQWETTKEATCTEEGSKRKDCSRCDYFETAEIPATGHSHNAVVTEPTCTQQGYTAHTCHCGDTYVDNYVEALGHSFTDYKSNDDATCTEDGTESAKCDRCDETDTRADKSSAKGHSYAKQVTKPTCTAKGYTTYTCACGDTYQSDEVEALGHSYDAGKVTKKATCKVAGVKTYTCKTCGETKTSVIAKLTKHTYSNNCDTTCNVCGGKRSVKHTYSNNCDTTCNVCNAKRTAPHTYSNSCDTSCNSCKAKRSIKHTYSNSCDTKCNVCKKTRKITHTYKTITTKATLTKNGKTVKQCSVCGKVSSTKTIKYAKTVKLSTTTYSYDGKVKTPSVTVKDSGGKSLKKGTDYTVTYSAGRKNVGIYTVTVKLMGKYSGTKVLTFKVCPAKVSISKLTAGKGSITVSWKKVSQITGYQIQYSTSKSFSGAKTVTATGSATSYALKGLKTKKKYYVRVRTYKIVDGTKIYSDWSSSKNIKTK